MRLLFAHKSGSNCVYLLLIFGENILKNRINTVVLGTTLASVLALLAVGCSKTTDGMQTPTAGTTTSTTIGTDIDDSVITSGVKTALMGDPDIKSFDFKVETRKGEVLLSGFVDSQMQLDRAKAVTFGVSGVKSIQNNVTLKGAPTTVGNTVDDSIITGKVKTALLADAQVKSLDISVVTRKDEVQLSGYVDNQAQITRAMDVARGVEGVRRVNNEMSVKK
jgi:hyperosmotically inducible periplasmic protein